MNNNRRFWLWAALIWLGIVALSSIFFSVVLRVLSTEAGCLIALVLGVLLWWCFVLLFRRRAYENPNAPVLRVEERVLIARPLPEVFAFLSDVQNEPRWVPQVVEVTLTSSGPLGVGATYRERLRANGVVLTVDYVVTVYDPPRHMAVRGVVRRRPVTASYTLTAAGERTLVETAADMPLSVLSVPFRPLYASIARRQTRGLLRRLQHELEQSK